MRLTRARGLAGADESTIHSDESTIHSDVRAEPPPFGGADAGEIPARRKSSAAGGGDAGRTNRQRRAAGSGLAEPVSVLVLLPEVASIASIPGYRPWMNVAEVSLVLAVVVLPVVLGSLAAVARRPWWWAAVAAVLLAIIAAIAPTPEEGEPRVAAGDLVFLLVVALWVTGLAWSAFVLVRRYWVRRRDSGAASSP